MTHFILIPSDHDSGRFNTDLTDDCGLSRSSLLSVNINIYRSGIHILPKSLVFICNTEVGGRRFGLRIVEAKGRIW